jgi:hypothetical protein
MNRLRFALSLMAVSFVFVAYARSADQPSPELTRIVTKIIEERVALLNTILAHPDKATIGALDRLTGHHEHGDEPYFFINSITDGNVNLGERMIPHWKKLEKHLENSKNRSIALGHLRLTLLAYNRGRGESQPKFVIEKIQVAQCPDPHFLYCYNADLKYVVSKSNGSSQELPAAMMYYAVAHEPEEGHPVDADVTLDSLRVNRNEHLAWWR